MPYLTTYPQDTVDQQVADVAGDSCPRLTSSAEVARRLAQLDEHYIRSAFVPLDELAAPRPGGAAAVRREIAARRLPQPAYRLDDGTDMVPDDYFTLVDAAGSVDVLPAHFQSRYATAASPMGLPVVMPRFKRSGRTISAAATWSACVMPRPRTSLAKPTSSHATGWLRRRPKVNRYSLCASRLR